MCWVIGKKKEYERRNDSEAFIEKCSYVVEKHGKMIIIVSLISIVFSITGTSKLFVENSFINYFKEKNP